MGAAAIVSRPCLGGACSSSCPRGTSRTPSAGPSPRSASASPTPTCWSSTTAPSTTPPRRARRPGATVCPLPFNLGVGGAMRTGYRYALRHGYDVAVQIDADGQHDPRYLAAAARAARHAPTSSSAPASRPRRPLQGPRAAPLGDGAPRAGALPRCAQHAADRRDVGLPGVQPPRDLRLRHPLPRRVPRRHGRVAGHRRPRRVHDHPGAGDDARPHRRPRLALAGQGRASTCAAPSWRSCSPSCATGRRSSRRGRRRRRADGRVHPSPPTPQHEQEVGR